MIVKLMPVIECPGQQSKLFGIWRYLADGVRKVLEYTDGDVEFLGRSESAGINRHRVGDERALHERMS